MSKRRSNQGGAILTFIVIAVVLVAVTVGAIYFVQQRGAQVRREQAIAAADKQAADQKTQSASDAARRASDAARLAAATKANQATSQPSTSGTATTPKPSTPTASALPETGPESALLAMVALGSVVAASTYYVSSRRALARSL
jgi:cytoskeletal protein RodZ